MHAMPLGGRFVGGAEPAQQRFGERFRGQLQRQGQPLAAHSARQRERRRAVVVERYRRGAGIAGTGTGSAPAYVIGGISVRRAGACSTELCSRMSACLRLARATGVSIAAMSVRFLMANREIATILVGAATPEEIEESVVAAQAGPLPLDLHQTLQAFTSALPRRAGNRRDSAIECRRGWPVARYRATGPAWDGCRAAS